jgi:hypothetical protein
MKVAKWSNYRLFGKLYSKFAEKSCKERAWVITCKELWLRECNWLCECEIGYLYVVTESNKDCNWERNKENQIWETEWLSVVELCSVMTNWEPKQKTIACCESCYEMSPKLWNGTESNVRKLRMWGIERNEDWASIGGNRERNWEEKL